MKSYEILLTDIREVFTPGPANFGGKHIARWGPILRDEVSCHVLWNPKETARGRPEETSACDLVLAPPANPLQNDFVAQSARSAEGLAVSRAFGDILLKAGP